MEDIQRLIRLLSMFSERITQFTELMDRASATFKPANKEWSIVEIIGHLIDIDDVTINRINQALVQDQPVIQKFDQDASVAEKRYQESDIRDTLLAFIKQRNLTVQQLLELSPDQLARMAQDINIGGVSILQIVEQLTQHDDVHWQQLQDTFTASQSQN